MNLEQYRTLRQIELQRLFEQRQFLAFIAKHMPDLNHTAFRRFRDDHIKSAQLRLWGVRFAFSGRWSLRS